MDYMMIFTDVYSSSGYGSYSGGGGANQGYGQSGSYSPQVYGGYNQSSDSNAGSYNQGGYGGYGQTQSGRRRH